MIQKSGVDLSDLNMTDTTYIVGYYQVSSNFISGFHNIKAFRDVDGAYCFLSELVHARWADIVNTSMDYQKTKDIISQLELELKGIKNEIINLTRQFINTDPIGTDEEVLETQRIVDRVKELKVQCKEKKTTITQLTNELTDHRLRDYEPVIIKKEHGLWQVSGGYEPNLNLKIEVLEDVTAERGVSEVHFYIEKVDLV